MEHTRILLLIALLGAAATGLPTLRGATITVTSMNDSGPGTLRQALADAHDGDTITFDASLRDVDITLTSGQLVVDKNVTISSSDPFAIFAVNAGHTSRVFYVAPGKDVTMSGLSIGNGVAPPPYFRGAGIYNDHATLTLSRCTIINNWTEWGSGGGIYNDGYGGSATLTIIDCTITANSTVPGHGAGIFNWVGTVTITNSTLHHNSAGFDGGGSIVNVGTMTITNSTLSGNSALNAGGAILNLNPGTLTITNSTLSGNSAGGDGPDGIYNGGTLKIGHTILNTGSSGENIKVEAPGTVTSLGYNLSSDSGAGYLTAAGDQINTDPKLGPLDYNGGDTLTHLPASDSPAIDAGDPTFGMDQRGPGFQRVVNGRIDIGAVEVEAETTPTPTPTPTPTLTPKPNGHHWTHFHIS